LSLVCKTLTCRSLDGLVQELFKITLGVKRNRMEGLSQFALIPTSFHGLILTLSLRACSASNRNDAEPGQHIPALLLDGARIQGSVFLHA